MAQPHGTIAATCKNSRRIAYRAVERPFARGLANDAPLAIHARSRFTTNANVCQPAPRGNEERFFRG
nr:hypothetical protein WG70_28775 [Burkholderia oklahomensis EO147]